MLALIITLTLGADPVCFVAKDAEPGWKQVVIPAETPALAASVEIDQFRPGDEVEVIDDHLDVFLAGSHIDLGRTFFELNSCGGACRLEATFRDPLRGTKVDVTSWALGQPMSLLNEQRLPGKQLNVQWSDLGQRQIAIRVHNHLRDDPVLQSWVTTCRLNADKLPVSDAYRLTRSLYYFQPRGSPVLLCERPGVVPKVHRKNLPTGLPKATSVSRVN